MLIGRGDQSGALHHLNWRIRLFSIGAGLGIGGIWIDNSWLIWGAIASLLAGMALRFAPSDEGEDDGAAEAD